MDYGPFGHGGLDNDCIPTPRSRISRGSHTSVQSVDERNLGSNSSPSMQYGSDVNASIRQLELEAYGSVLRAFKAQDDNITWEKEGLITELRKELKLSNEEHKDILSGVNADDTLQRIRDWRQSGRLQPVIRTTSIAVHDSITRPSLPALRKKQKTASSLPFQSFGGLSPPFQPQMLPGTYSMPYSSGPLGRGQFGNHMPSRGLANEPTESVTLDPLVGRKVRTRWPADNNFYEAVIAEYNAAEDRHALVYDMGTQSETWEWVNLSEIAPEDIRWEGGDPRVSHREGYHGPGHSMNHPVRQNNAPGVGRGRGVPLGQSRKDSLPPLAGIGKNRVERSDDINLLDTAIVIREVERVFSTSNTPALVRKRAKKLLEDHEESLVVAISRIDELNDGDSLIDR